MRPKEIQSALGISAASLRSWSAKFNDHLSPAARGSVREDGGYTQRRYDEHDLAILQRAKTLLDRGLTFEEVNQSLGSDPTGEIYHDEPPSLALVPTPPSNGHEPLLALVEALNRQELALREQTELLRQLVTIQSRPWYRRLLG